MLGRGVGLEVGLDVGLAVGRLVGRDVGALDGLLVGNLVGGFVGNRVVGLNVCFVGDRVDDTAATLATAFPVGLGIAATIVKVLADSNVSKIVVS